MQNTQLHKEGVKFTKQYHTWCTSNKSIALISLSTTAVSSMIGVDADCIESTWIVSITRVLTGSSKTCLSQRAVIVARATHYTRATITRNTCTQEERGMTEEICTRNNSSPQDLLYKESTLSYLTTEVLQIFTGTSMYLLVNSVLQITKTSKVSEIMQCSVPLYTS